MIKPEAPDAEALCTQRAALGIGDRYSRDRLHITILRLWDEAETPAVLIERCIAAAASLRAEPLEICFTRLSGQMLVGGCCAPLHDLRRRLVERLSAFGIPVPARGSFKPHLSLAYGPVVSRHEPVDPIRWTARALLLVRSIHGEGRHERVGHWALEARQGSFPF